MFQFKYLGTVAVNLTHVLLTRSIKEQRRVATVILNYPCGLFLTTERCKSLVTRPFWKSGFFLAAKWPCWFALLASETFWKAKKEQAAAFALHTPCYTVQPVHIIFYTWWTLLLSRRIKQTVSCVLVEAEGRKNLAGQRRLRSKRCPHFALLRCSINKIIILEHNTWMFKICTIFCCCCCSWVKLWKKSIRKRKIHNILAIKSMIFMCQLHYSVVQVAVDEWRFHLWWFFNV